MSLATRCPACGTVFRVVQDQLKISGGWVRCGQCHEVFNGLQTLFELPVDPPAAAPTPPPAPEPTAPAAGLFVTREAPPPAPVPADTWEPTEPAALAAECAEPVATVNLADEDPDDAPLINPDASEPAPPPLPWAYRPQLMEADESEAETVMPQEDEDEGDEEAVAPETDSLSDEELLTKMDAVARGLADNFVISPPPALPAWRPPDDGQTADAEPTTVMASVIGPAHDGLSEQPPALAEAPPTAKTWPPDKTTRRHRRSKRQRKPAFMRQAERAARWRSPAVRALLGGTSAILGLMLVLQMAHQQRNELAARWPAVRSPLAAWCRLANCQLQPPRALASLTLDSSALSRTTRPQVLRFEAELRNSASHAVRAPALEVSFTDNLGHQLVRKVLLPEQMGAPVEGLPPNHPWRIEVPLQVGDLPIAGFTAEVFYP